MLALAQHIPLLPKVSSELESFGEGDTLTVFIHGYLASGGVLRPLGDYLAARALAPRQLHFSFAPTGSVAEHVQRLDALIQKVHRPGAALHIVGHSLGGLLGRYYRQVLGRPVERLICIATPHAGVPRAAVFRALKALPLVDELAPGSATLQLLQATRSRLAPTEVTCVIPEGDTLVPPEQSAALSGTECVFVPSQGHLSVLFARDTWEVVGERLERPLRREPVE
jgi:pimeloyl-ACP methyl ester carboxylesterase